MLSEILVGFATTALAVVAGIGAAEGLKWAMRVHPKERTGEIDAGVCGPKDIPWSPSEESVLSTLRDLGSSPLYPNQGSVLTSQAFRQMEMDHHVRPNSSKHGRHY